MNLLDEHHKKVDKIVSQIRSYHKSKENKKIRFTHGSTNSTRVQDKSNFYLIDISSLNQVIKIDNVKNIAVVEPNLPMDKLVALCLQKGVLPKVVMEFPGITCGGGINGAALEASSFKFGQFNDTCREYEVILGNGEVRTVNRKKHADLFYGIAGSYGSLALLTCLTLELISAKSYVNVSFTPVKTASLVNSISLHCRKDFDFIEGIVFDREKALLIMGKLSKKIKLPLHTFSKAKDEWFYLYAKKQLAKGTQTSVLVPLQDYLFRYNRGAFWTGKYAFAMFHMPFTRLTRWLLNPFMNTRTMYKGLHDTNLAQNFFIQDFYIPFSQADKFLQLSIHKQDFRLRG